MVANIAKSYSDEWARQELTHRRQQDTPIDVLRRMTPQDKSNAYLIQAELAKRGQLEAVSDIIKNINSYSKYLL